MRFKDGDLVRVIEEPHDNYWIKKDHIYLVTRATHDFVWLATEKGEAGGWHVNRFELCKGLTVLKESKSSCIQLT
jgi:hypothetical protein